MAGIDFGNMNCYLAVARNKGIEILLNEYSLHATPSCVSFGQSARLMGFGSRQQMNVHYRNTVLNFKHLLGRKHNDPIVKKFSDFIPCEIEPHPNGTIEFKVSHLGEQVMLKPEQVLACLFTHLRYLLVKSMGADVTECVINVPFFFGEQQRISMLTAGRIAGINFRLINDHAALAYNYGMYKGMSLPKSDEPPKIVAFVDCGHSATQVSIIAFNAGKAKILGAAYDLSVGGLHFDAVIRDSFAEQFKGTYKIDVRKNARAWFRLLDECEKLKKQMSANSQSIPLYIECLMDDVDISANMQRDEFEELAAPLFDKLQTLLQQLIQTSQVRIEDISDVELIGGSTRIPRVRQLTADIFKQEPKTTMNQDDAIARGCALRCAMFYPVYQMKEFLLEDPYDITIETTKLPIEGALTGWLNHEQEMQAADKRDKERSDAKNALEEYCFHVQHSMGNEQLCQGKVDDAARLESISECDKTLNWLDMESDQLQKKQIECRHDELEKFCAPFMDKLYAIEKKEDAEKVKSGENANGQQEKPPSPAKKTKNEANADGQEQQVIVEEPMD